jgi:hypothetical protein
MALPGLRGATPAPAIGRRSLRRPRRVLWFITLYNVHIRSRSTASDERTHRWHRARLHPRCAPRILAGASRETGLVLGVNAAMGSQSVERQNAILAAMRAAGVRCIRAGSRPITRDWILLGARRRRTSGSSGPAAISTGRAQSAVAQHIRHMGRTSPLRR